MAFVRTLIRILTLLQLLFSNAAAAPLDPRALFDRATITPLFRRSKVILEILRFISANYVAHAFTAKAAPGHDTVYATLFGLAALFFPYSGLIAACRSIEQYSLGEKDPLKRAARAGALCMVARTKYWRPRSGDNVWCWEDFNDGDYSNARRISYEPLDLEPLSQRYIAVHGLCKLPRPESQPGTELKSAKSEGASPEDTSGAGKTTPERRRYEYMLVRVPVDFAVKWKPLNINEEGYKSLRDYKKRKPRPKDYQGDFESTYKNRPRVTGEGDERGSETVTKFSQYGISNSHSVAKSILALIQLVSAFPVILEARNNKRGYGAYQLTLIPYSLMSFMNAVSSILVPTYNSVYMIRSSTMTEAERRGGQFDGVVGELYEEICVAPCQCTEPCSCPKPCYPSCNHSKPDSELDLRSDSDPKTLNFRPVCFRSPPASGGPFATTDPKDFPSDEGAQIRDGKVSLGDFKEMFLDTLRYIFLILIPEFLKREIYLVRYRWRTSLRTLQVNVRRTFKRAPLSRRTKETGKLLMISPIGHPWFRRERLIDKVMTIVADLLLIVSLGVPYLVTGVLTHFETGTSRWYERALFMTWLLLGQVSHVVYRLSWGYLQTRVAPLGTKWLTFLLAVIMAVGGLYTAAGIGGFFIVGLMMYDDKRSLNATVTATCAVPSGSATGI